MKKILILLAILLPGVAMSQKVIEPYVTANKVVLDSAHADSVPGGFWWDNSNLKVYDGTSWVTLGGGSAGDASYFDLTGTVLSTKDAITLMTLPALDVSGNFSVGDTTTFGDGAAGQDIVLKFNGESNSSTFIYNEEHDFFEISDPTKLYFRNEAGNRSDRYGHAFIDWSSSTDNGVWKIRRSLDFSHGLDYTLTGGVWEFKADGGFMVASNTEQSYVSILPAVKQTATANYVGLLINSTETSTGSGQNYLFDARLAGVTKFNVTNGGNVGIGTASPTEKLDIGYASGVFLRSFRGTTDSDITGWIMTNENGDTCYVYPNAAGNGIEVSTTKP
jgi:hypothetical protein